MYMKGYTPPAQPGLMVKRKNRREEGFICQTGNNKRSIFWEEIQLDIHLGRTK